MAISTSMIVRRQLSVGAISFGSQFYPTDMKHPNTKVALLIHYLALLFVIRWVSHVSRRTSKECKKVHNNKQQKPVSW
jgi:hypothetical protein